MQRPLVRISRHSSADVRSAAQDPVPPAMVVARETQNSAASLWEPLLQAGCPSLPVSHAQMVTDCPPATKRADKVIYIFHNQEIPAGKMNSQ